VYLDPVQDEATAFAPATVANLGPGFDWLGCAVEVRPRCADDSNSSSNSSSNCLTAPRLHQVISV
jgi:homoserine kinase